jgi:hypothetical protein
MNFLYLHQGVYDDLGGNLMKGQHPSKMVIVDQIHFRGMGIAVMVTNLAQYYGQRL